VVKNACILSVYNLRSAFLGNNIYKALLVKVAILECF